MIVLLEIEVKLEPGKLNVQGHRAGVQNDVHMVQVFHWESEILER